MNAPYTCQAILLAYHIAPDREVVDILKPAITIADNAQLEFFQTAAFKLEQARWLAYISYGKQRVITANGRSQAQRVQAALIERFGNLDPRELIARLAPDCLRELNAWLAEGAPTTTATEVAHA